jgi:hypothetical protein
MPAQCASVISPHCRPPTIMTSVRCSYSHAHRSPCHVAFGAGMAYVLRAISSRCSIFSCNPANASGHELGSIAWQTRSLRIPRPRHHARFSGFRNLSNTSPPDWSATIQAGGLPLADVSGGKPKTSRPQRGRSMTAFKFVWRISDNARTIICRVRPALSSLGPSKRSRCRR